MGFQVFIGWEAIKNVGPGLWDFRDLSDERQVKMLDRD